MYILAFLGECIDKYILQSIFVILYHKETRERLALMEQGNKENRDQDCIQNTNPHPTGIINPRLSAVSQRIAAIDPNRGHRAWRWPSPRKYTL